MPFLTFLAKSTDFMTFLGHHWFTAVFTVSKVSGFLMGFEENDENHCPTGPYWTQLDTPDPYHGHPPRSAPCPITTIPRVPPHPLQQHWPTQCCCSGCLSRPDTVHQASFGYSKSAKNSILSVFCWFLLSQKPTCQKRTFCRKSLPNHHIKCQKRHFCRFWRFWHFFGHFSRHHWFFLFSLYLRCQVFPLIFVIFVIFSDFQWKWRKSLFFSKMSPTDLRCEKVHFFVKKCTFSSKSALSL